MKYIYIRFVKKNNSKDITGESLDSEHKGWIEVNFWAQGIHQPVSSVVSSAGGHGVERCEHAPMYFSKDVDKSSVYLWEACSAAYSYDVEIEFLRSSGSVRTTYLKINLSNAIISSVETKLPENGLPSESFSIRYAKIIWEHKGSKSDGSANVGRDSGGWDLAFNKATA